MTYLVISAIIFTVLTIVFFFMSSHSDWVATFGSLGVITGLFAFALTIVVMSFGYDWYAANYKASIINREYGTNYSREEVFYAKDVIDTIQQINRKRIEVNGNVMQNKCPENADVSAVTNTVVDEVNASFFTDTDTSLTY